MYWRRPFFCQHCTAPPFFVALQNLRCLPTVSCAHLVPYTRSAHPRRVRPHRSPCLPCYFITTTYAHPLDCSVNPSFAAAQGRWRTSGSAPASASLPCIPLMSGSTQTVKSCGFGQTMGKDSQGEEVSTMASGTGDRAGASACTARQKEGDAKRNEEREGGIRGAWTEASQGLYKVMERRKQLGIAAWAVEGDEHGRQRGRGLRRMQHSSGHV